MRRRTSIQWQTWTMGLAPLTVHQIVQEILMEMVSLRRATCCLSSRCLESPAIDPEGINASKEPPLRLFFYYRAMKFILSKVLGFPTALVILFLTFCSVNSARAQNLQEDDLALVEGLLDQMTLEDKVGQMTQLTLGFLSTSQKQHDGRP